MIEHLRKYTGLIIFVVALLFVGLAFFGDTASMGGGNANDPPVLSVDGSTYSFTEVQKGGKSTRQLAEGLRLFDLLMATDGFTMGEDPQADQRFFVNRLLLQQAREEFGVHPSDEEVTASLKTITAFQGQDGSFDQQRYNDIATKFIGSLGMDEQDMIELLRDNLATRKLGEIIGGGLAADRKFAAEQVASSDQQLSIQLARVPLAKFQDSLKPSDEELKTAWETTKEKYQTERRIKVSYFIAKPNYPELKLDAPKLPDAVTEEAKKAAEKDAADKKAAAEAAHAETKRGVDNELADVVDAFLQELESSDGKDLEKLATENQWEVVTTDFFTRATAPPALAANLRSASNPRPVADILFQLSLGKESMSRFTDALPIADGAFLIARLDEEEAVRTKNFDEAKEEVRVDFIAKAAGEALKKDADEKAAKIREGLAAGKAFADLAKEQGLEPKPLGPFKASDKLDGEADVSLLFQTASLVDPGSLADPVLRPDGSLFVFVDKREVVKDPARETRIESSLQGLIANQQRLAFSAWMSARFAAAKVEEITTR